MGCWDSNPSPLHFDSSPKTTRPGLPPPKGQLLAPDFEAVKSFMKDRSQDIQSWLKFG